MSFNIVQEKYSGPLELLLELVLAQKQAISELSLAKVAEDFLTHINGNEVPPEEIADFLVIASRLIYIKARSLAPYLATPEEDEEAGKLADQLRAYQLLTTVAKTLASRFGFSSMRERRIIAKPKERQFLPASNVTKELMVASMQAILRRLAPFLRLREANVARTVSLEEKVESIRQALKVRAKLRFDELVARGSQPAEIVVSFLALLELLRHNLASVEQGEVFAPISIEQK